MNFSKDSNSFQIANVTVFDGEKIINRAQVIVLEGIISNVIDLDREELLPHPSTLIDGAGKFLMPSMIDSEGHFMLTPDSYLNLITITDPVVKKNQENQDVILRPSFLELYKKFSENKLLTAVDTHGLYGRGSQNKDKVSAPIDSTCFEKYLRFGVTTVLDMAAYPWPASYFKRSRDAWKKENNHANQQDNQKEIQDLKNEFMIYSDLFTSGMWAIPANLQFGYFGVDPVYNLKPEGPWGEEDIQAWVERRIQEGSDHIKIFYHSWGPETPIDKKFTPATLNALVKSAHDKDMLVYTHNQVVGDAYDVMLSGSDAVIHTPGSYGELKNKIFSDDFARDLVSRIKFIVPTLGVLLQNCESPYALANRFTHALGQENPGASFTETYVESSDVLPYIYATDEMRLLSCGSRGNPSEDEVILQKVAKVYDFGAKLLTGIDPDTTSSAIEGLGVHYELFLIREALVRYSEKIKSENLNVEVLKTATSNPSLAYGLHKENGHKPKHDPRGFIKKGYRADLLLLKESPLINILNTLKIEKIWKAGFLFDRKMVRPECADGNGPTRKIIRELMAIR